MIARAPGKIVISGAYAVLEGAPAIVAAVDRYAIADTSRTTDSPTPEVSAVLGTRAAPAFDASALRQGGHKLGLGSSAAILVASLAALELERRGPLPDDALVAAVLEPALAAHRRAQRGGSGIDVAASAWGGVLVAERDGDSLRTRRAQWPSTFTIRVWASGEPASTAELLARVSEFRSRAPTLYRELLDELAGASELARAAMETGDCGRFVSALNRQCAGLGRLGNATGAPIVTDAVRTLARSAAAEGAAVLPSGAGGGDIALYVGRNPPSPALSAEASALGQHDLGVGIGARGVHGSVLSVG